MRQTYIHRHQWNEKHFFETLLYDRWRYEWFGQDLLLVWNDDNNNNNDDADDDDMHTRWWWWNYLK